MATNKNVQIKTWNGVDFDSLFPKTKAAITMMNDGTTVESTIASIVTSLNGKTTLTDVQTEIAKVVGSAPAALDTLIELANALGNDANFATTMTNNLANKVDKVAGKGLSTNDFTTALKTKLDALIQVTVSPTASAPATGLWFEVIS